MAFVEELRIINDLVAECLQDDSTHWHRVVDRWRGVSEETTTRRNLREQWRRSFEQLKLSAMPQVNPVEFPAGWNDLQGLR